MISKIHSESTPRGAHAVNGGVIQLFLLASLRAWQNYLPVSCMYFIVDFDIVKGIFPPLPEYMLMDMILRITSPSNYTVYPGLIIKRSQSGKIGSSPKYRRSSLVRTSFSSIFFSFPSDDSKYRHYPSE